MPFPRGNLRDLQRHAQPLFVLAHALVGARQRGRALVDAPLELLVRLLERFLRLLAFGDLSLQRFVQLGERARLPEQSTNTPIFERRISALIGLLR